MPSTLLRSFLAFALVFAAACSGGSGSSPAPGSAPTLTPAPIVTPTFAPPTIATTQVRTATTPVTVPLPSVGGFGGSILIPGDTHTAGTVLTITASTSVPPAAQAHARRPQDATVSTPLLYLTVTAQGASQLFAQPGFSITLPPNVTTAGTAFYLSVFDPQHPNSNYLIGPGTLSQNTLTFVTGSSALTFTAGQTYAFVLFGLNSPGPTPTPVPPSSNIREFAISGSPIIQGIATGSDGNLWFVGNPSAGTGPHTLVWKMTTTGVLSGPFTTSLGSNPYSIVSGPDGALWFTEQSGHIGRITTSGSISEFSTGALTSPLGLAFDGNTLWVTGGGSGQIAAFTTSGTLLHAPFPVSGSPMKIVRGADGAMWFTDDIQFDGQTAHVGRITIAGGLSEFPIPARPFDITNGQDGNVWFTEDFGNNIGRVTPTGTVSEFFVGANAAIYGMVTASDGTFWFTELSAGAIGHMSATGTLLATYPFPSQNTGSTSLCIGPDGKIWFTEQGGKVGVLTP